MDFRRVR